jgi:hypothetical protein
MQVLLEVAESTPDDIFILLKRHQFCLSFTAHFVVLRST